MPKDGYLVFTTVKTRTKPLPLIQLRIEANDEKIEVIHLEHEMAEKEGILTEVVGILSEKGEAGVEEIHEALKQKRVDIGINKLRNILHEASLAGVLSGHIGARGKKIYGINPDSQLHAPIYTRETVKIEDAEPPELPLLTSRETQGINKSGIEISVKGNLPLIIRRTKTHLYDQLDFRERHRRQRFSDFVGNRRTIQILKNMVNVGKLPKAILFFGPAGTGKTSLAFNFGRAINCENFADDVCGVCQSCRELKSLSSATGFWGLPAIVDCTEVNKSDLEKILNSFRYVSPSKTRRHILIFDEFHRLTWRLEDELLIPVEKQNNILLAFCLFDLKKVSEPFLQRVAVLETSRPEIEELIPWVKKICDKEGIGIKDPKGLRQIVIEADRLPRECLSQLETTYYLREPLTVNLVKEVAKNRRGIGNNGSE